METSAFTNSKTNEPWKTTEKSILQNKNASDEESKGDTFSVTEYIMSSPGILSGIVILIVTLVVLILVIVICMKKKMKMKSLQIEEETYASVVQYVQLDLTSSETSIPETNCDAPYAKIIGTISNIVTTGKVI
ncbi:hypothetical protein O0L34_g11575 [Tuta absoluta]|nr:hypothetical protein O0L34_g11575 [Tuta absoluta]